MLAPLLIGLALQSPLQAGAGRYELAERLKRLDVVWMATKDAARRRDAIPSINSAVTSFFSMRTAEAAQSMDEAIAKLENRRLRSADAINVRPERPFNEPGATINLKISWAYRPSSVIPVRVGVSNKEVDVKPGATASLSVNPWVVNPELRQSQEVGYLMPIRVGNDVRYVYLSFVRKLDDRLRRLAGSDNVFVSETAKLLAGYQANPLTMETELPLVQYLFSAEAVEDGKSKVAELDQVYFARSGSTPFRAAFPKGKSDKPLNLVIAVHGAGGSENMFFESYGRGLAVSEALRRGWAFAAPRAGATCIDDVVDWVEKNRNAKVGRIFLIGHSMGGGVVLGGRYRVEPTAIAAFAPATNRIADSLFNVPIWVLYGKSDPLAMAGAALRKAMEGRGEMEFREQDPGEHLMVAADGLPDAYRFFDRFAR